MPDRLASDGSVEASPVRLYSIQSLHHRLVAPSSSSAWLSCRQRSTAEVVPAYGPVPLTSNWRVMDPSEFQPSTISPARPSVQRIAGPRGLPSPSISQLPSPWPVALTPRISSALTEPPTSAWLIASVAATHTSCMSSSARWGSGLVMGTLRAPRLSSLPCRSKIAALTTDVPASNPRMYPSGMSFSPLSLRCIEVVLRHTLRRRTECAGPRSAAQ